MFGVSFLTIHVSDQPVAPSLGLAVPTFSPSVLARFAVRTPPTQWRTWGGLLVGVTVCDRGGWGCCAARGGDGVADEDAFGADEDVLDEQAQDALLLGDGGGGGVAAEPGEEVLQAGGELEVGLAVDELVGQGGELTAQAGLAGA